MTNEVPQLFDWDQVRNQPGDRWARAELNHSCVEFVAPTEYMVRPPQPAVYIFLIDVSHTAVQSGKSLMKLVQIVFFLKLLFRYGGYGYKDHPRKPGPYPRRR